MPPTPIVDVLQEVFRTHGFDTTAPAHPEDGQGRTHRVDLLAEQSGIDILVTTTNDPQDICRRIEEIARVRDALGARYALIAAPHPLDGPGRESGRRHNVIAWDDQQIAQAIGRAVLLEVTGADVPPIAELLTLSPLPTLPMQGPTHEEKDEGEPLPFADLLDDPAALPPIAAAKAPAEHPPAPVRNVESGRGWYLETRSTENASPSTTQPAPPMAQAPPSTPPTIPNPPSSPTPLPTPSSHPDRILGAPGARAGIPTSTGKDPHTFTPRTGALLAPTVDKDSAAKAACNELFSISSTRLRYHPKRLYQWSVDAFVEGQVDTHTLTGVCLVDVATKKLEVPAEWKAPRHLREGTFDVPVDHKPVRMETEHARTLVTGHVLDATARDATMQDDDSAGDYALTVKRRVRVQEADIRIDDQGLHWCPVWWISGTNGEMEVDALTGQVLHKQLQNTPSETILL